MASSQGQDIILCHLCPNPVEHHCNLCHVDLCVNCVSKHLTDKSKRHEVVDFINKKEEFILPECKSHDNKLCEVYCNDCHEPACVLCVTTTHKKHDITDITSIIENLMRRIIVDVEELENIIRPKYRKDFGISISSAEFDKVINAIQDQEDTMCKVVRKIGSRLKDEVAKQMRELIQTGEKVYSSVAKQGSELDAVIKANKGILKSNDAKFILTYQSKNEQFRGGPKQMQFSYPMFSSGKVSQNQFQKMFGSLQRSKSLAPEEKLGIKKMMSNLVVLSAIQTPYGKSPELWRVLCEETGNMWISGYDCNIYQIDQNGTILQTINVGGNAYALSLNAERILTFSLDKPHTKVYKYDGQVVSTVIDLCQWCPRGLCHSANGDLLVSMRSIDETQSRVVRFSGRAETMVIQNDSQGALLFSVGTPCALHLIENGKGDICVADYAGEAVIVVNAFGKLRFKYRRNIPPKSNYKIFQPSKIASDVNQQILINDASNEIMHVIDKDGKFLRYIDYPSSGGLSINPDHNLVVGDLDNGKIRIIKYFQ